MSISRWIHHNLVASGADGGTSRPSVGTPPPDLAVNLSGLAPVPVGPDPDEQQLQNDVDHIKDQADQIKQPVKISVQGGYNSLSKRDQAVLGAGGGAVVGGAPGGLKGLLTAAAPATVDAHWQTHAILQPPLSFDPIRSQVRGVTQVATANRLQDVTVPNAAVRYHFQPDIAGKPIGTYQTPGDVSVQHPFTTNSVVVAAEGMAVGALGGVAGVAAGVASNGIRKSVDA